MILHCFAMFWVSDQLLFMFFFFFFSSRRRHTRCREVSWARRCVQETGTWDLLPENQYRPDILDVPNPEIIKEENGEDLENAEKKEQLYLKEIERLKEDNSRAVSYTHLTLPTILLVQISVVAVSLKKKKKYSQNSEQLNQLKLELQEDTITHGRTQLTIDIAT
eukprot:TRINITY_DN24585_c0_g1_i4.p1 TRINITY_DN24585_c0_g1~~TRINITY_DN24585_c0_g1_i4.p1  ORF type:complete len:182 (-),score=75.66 TRINITY_DN24585_c0_g1_i4:1-492(-)